MREFLWHPCIIPHLCQNRISILFREMKQQRTSSSCLRTSASWLRSRSATLICCGCEEAISCVADSQDGSNQGPVVSKSRTEDISDESTLQKIHVRHKAAERGCDATVTNASRYASRNSRNVAQARLALCGLLFATSSQRSALLSHFEHASYRPITLTTCYSTLTKSGWSQSVAKTPTQSTR